MKKIIVFAFSVFLFWGTAWAAKITAQDALVAAQRWITITDAAPLNAKFARSVPTVRTIGGDTGKDLFHIVEMAGGGFVVMPADDRISPIVAFSSTGTVVEDDENPLWDMLSTDLRAAMAAAEDGGTVSALGSRKGSTTDNPTAQWKALLSDDAVARKGGLANVTEWVAPLLKSKWDQTKVGSKNVYNYYTPGHYPCGCVATAMAQLLRYHEYPTASITPQAFTCTVSGVATNTMMMGGGRMPGHLCQRCQRILLRMLSVKRSGS